MHFIPRQKAAAAVYLFSAASAFPLEASTQSRIDCSNIHQGPAGYCWNQLQVSSYITKFNNDTTSTGGVHPWPMCKANELWSTCFLRDSYGKSGHDCSNINSTTCTAPVVGKEPFMPQEFYGSYNIWAVQHYITAWAKGVASTNIFNIVRPDRTGGLTETPSLLVDDVLYNLISLDNQTSVAKTTALQNLLASSPSNATVDTAGLTQEVQQRFNQLLFVVASNVTAFLEFTANGTFSTTNVTESIDITNVLCPVAKGEACGQIAHTESG